MNKQEALEKKEFVLNKINNSKDELRKYNRKNNINKEDLALIIKKILEWEATDTQKIIDKYYIQWKSYKEISQELDLEEYEILGYFQYIIYKISNVLNPKIKNSPYSASNFWKKSKWDLIDKKW